MDEVESKCPERHYDAPALHAAASSGSQAYVFDMSSGKKSAEDSAQCTAEGSRDIAGFGRAQPYFEAIKNDQTEARRTRSYFRLFFSFIYFLCGIAWIYWHLTGLNLSDDMRLSDWLKQPAVLAMLRDYLLCLAGYAFLMSMLNLILK